MDKFILFCGARTGSSALHSYLMDLGVNIRFEPFRPSKWSREFNVQTELFNIFSKADAIKHLYDHLLIEQNVALLQWALHYEMKVIFLRRRDLRANALSKAIAFQTGWWKLRMEHIEHVQMHAMTEIASIDIAWLDEILKEMKQAVRVFDLVMEDNPLTMNLFYEDVFNRTLDDARDGVGCLLEFLGLKDEHWMNLVSDYFSASLKQTRESVYERIPNWKEISLWLEEQ